MKLRSAIPYASGIAIVSIAIVSASSPGGGGGSYYGGYHPQQQQQQYNPQQQQQQQQQYNNQYYNQQQQQQYGQAQGYHPSQQTQSQPNQQSSSSSQQVSEPKEVEDKPESNTSLANDSTTESDALPSPWQEHVDPSSGKSYYYNPETSVTQWERPASPPQVSAAANTEEVSSTESNQVTADTVESTGSMGVVTEETKNEDTSSQSQVAVEEASISNPQLQSEGGDATMVPFENAFASTVGNSSDQQQGNSVDSEIPKEEKHQQQNIEQPSQQFGMGGQRDGGYQQQMPPQQPWGVNQQQLQGSAQPPQQQRWGQPEQPPSEKAEQESPKPEPQSNQQQSQHQQQPGWPQVGQQQKQPPSEMGQQQNAQPRPGWGMPSPMNQQQQPGPAQNHQQQSRPPMAQNQPPPQNMQSQFQGGRPGYGLPPRSNYPPPQNNQQYPPQYPNQPQYNQQYPPGYNPYGAQTPPQNTGPGAGQLVQQRTEDLSNAVKEKWGQALGGLSVFGNRTKELAENARTSIGESATAAQKTIGETSTGKFSDWFPFCQVLISDLSMTV